MKKLLKFFTLLLGLLFFTVFSNKILIISIPKCGTNLLVKAIDLLLGKPFGLTNTWIRRLEINENCINSVIDVPDFTPLYEHGVYNEWAESQLITNNIKTLFIYRDPRDQLISYIFWHKERLTVLDNCSMDESIFRGIEHGVKELYFNWPGIIGIDQFYRSFIPWIQSSIVYSLRFEDLVGPQGGGSLEAQIRELENIAYYIGLTVTSEQVNKVAEMLFGESMGQIGDWTTFREGQIGSWKNILMKNIKKFSSV